MRLVIILALCLFSYTNHAQNQDSTEVVITTEKYIQAFYSGKPEALEAVLHPELVKRTMKSFPASEKFLSTSGKSEMVELSKIFNAKERYNANSKSQIEVLDLFKEIATVKLSAEGWTDHLQLVKIKDKWQIINILWIMN